MSRLSSGEYSSHSPGRLRAGSEWSVSPTSMPMSRAVRASLPAGADFQATNVLTAARMAARTIDCHRKIVDPKGMTPVTLSMAAGMLAGLACNCAEEDDSPRAHTVPVPRHAAAPAAR